MAFQEPISFELTLEGVDTVTAGFYEVGESAELTGATVEHAFRDTGRGATEMSSSLREVVQDIHVLTGTTRGILGLADAFGILSREEMKGMYIMLQMVDVVSGVIRVIEVLTTVEWGLVAAKTARGIASAITFAIETLGLGIPLLIGAAVTAAGAISAVYASVPSHHYPGIIERTGLYYMAAGQPVGAPGVGAGTVVHIHQPVFRDHSDMNWLVDRLRRMGQA